MSSTATFSLRFAAVSAGDHTVGPVSITSSGRTICRTDIFTVTATGSGPVTSGAGPSDSNEEHGDEIAWMTVEIDTTGRIYPGQPFNVDYYICKTIPTAEIVDLYLEPSDYATSTLVDDIEHLQWNRTKNGVYRTWLATLQVTPAFACTLSLPVLSGRIGLPGGLSFHSREYVISTSGTTVPVFPFPEEGRPDNFTGLTDPVIFTSRLITRGYSPGGERCVQITASGSGAQSIHCLPDLSVSGPAELLAGRGYDSGDEERSWDMLVDPSDSGRVVVGPDSIAWFDTEREEYVQSLIPACTLSVYPITTRPADISGIMDNGSDSTLFWITAVSLLLLLLTFLILRFRKKIIGMTTDIAETKDIEELLTAFGDTLSKTLTGSRAYMGSEELDEALDGSQLDVMLCRRVLRHWKDLELLLSGRQVSAEHLERLKRKSIELLSEIEKEMQHSSDA